MKSDLYKVTQQNNKRPGCLNPSLLLLLYKIITVILIVTIS